MEIIVMTRKQISERYSVSMQTVKKWDKKGLIKPCEMLNGRPRYLRTEVEALSQKKEAK
jgi:predicted site-specific integrase-resolvase